MSLFPSIFRAGLGWLGLAGPAVAVADDAQAAAADKPLKPAKELERPAGLSPDGYCGRSYGGAPGFAELGLFGIDLHWRMRRYHAIALAYAITVKPAIAGTRSIEIAKGLKKGEQALAEKMKAAAEHDVLPAFNACLPAAFECLHFGWQLQEVVWGVRAGGLYVERVKPFLPWQAIPYQDRFGNFVGYQSLLSGEYRDARYAYLSVNNAHVHPIRGESRNEFCGREWHRSQESEANADRIELKASSKQMLLYVATGAAFADAAGRPFIPDRVAELVKQAAVDGEVAVLPLSVFDADAIRQNPELANVRPVVPAMQDWGDTSPAIAANIQRLDRLDRSMMQAWCRPAREAMEAKHGARNEGVAQGQIGTTDTEQVHADRCREWDCQALDRWGAQRFGGAYRPGMIRTVPAPLTDAQQQWIRDVLTALLGNAATAADTAKLIDRRAALEGSEVPTRSKEDVAADDAAAAAAAPQQGAQPGQPPQAGGNPPPGAQPPNAAAGKRDPSKMTAAELLAELRASGKGGSTPGAVKLSADASGGGGHWVTLQNGQHAYIDGEGVIAKGPPVVLGTKPGKAGIAEHHRGHTDPRRPPPARAAAGKSSRVPEQAPSPRTKSEIAKQSATRVDKEMQRYAEEKNEAEVARGIGGLAYDDNEPVDVVAGQGAGGVVRHGAEVKTLIVNKAGKLTMDRYSQVRKVNWEREKKATFHTIAVDDREVYNAKGPGLHDESKRAYYYRRGIAGSARVNTMHKAADLGEVRRLMEAPDADLPAGAARADDEIRVGTWRPINDGQGRGFRNGKTGEVVRPKK